MQIFIDSADKGAIGEWLDMGLVDGATTNPSIMLKDGVYDMEKGARELAELISPRPLSVEVTTNCPGEMVRQARRFASWGSNMVIKVPQTTPDGVPCYGVIRELEAEGIRVNATATMSTGQVMLAAKAGASYISIFWGRVADEGGNAAEVVRNSVEWLERWHYPSRVIVGSIRSLGDVLGAAQAGAHIITIPPQFLRKMADHKYTRETVRQFTADAQKALELMTAAQEPAVQV
jgi:transaldolase